MWHEAKLIRIGGLALAAVVGACCTGPAAAQSSGEGVTRGVHIMEAPTPQTSAPAAPAQNPDTTAVPSPAPGSATAPPVASPGSPAASTDTGGAAPTAPSGSDATASAPLLTPPSAPPPPAADTAPRPNNVANVPNSSDFGMRLVPQNFAALSAAMQIPNAAGLALQMLPGQELATGSPISFQVSAKRPGYLILLDVSAAGKLNQIYPNPMSLLEPNGVSAKSNLLRPGEVLKLPDRQNPYAGFELVAEPPAGTAMVIAMLSEHPVQLVDLPDVPVSLLGSASMVDYLVNLSNQLRIPNAGGDGGLEDAHWSFDVKFYAIR